MESKITEIITEPNKIHIGSSFKLKIRATRYATYDELKEKTYNDTKNYTYNQLKGV